MENNERLRIWFIEYDDNGNEIGRGVYYKSYAYYGTAKNIAEKLYGDRKKFKYGIGILSPFEKHYKTVKCWVCGKEYQVEMTSHGYCCNNHFHIHDARENPGRRGYICASCCGDCIDSIKNHIESLKGE